MLHGSETLSWCAICFVFSPLFSPDDGKLSFDEFKAYFSDGVLTAEELKELFHTIDTHNTESVASFCALSDMGKQRDSNCFYPVFPSNVDTDELCGKRHLSFHQLLC